jgi:hypothetical protein
VVVAIKRKDPAAVALGRKGGLVKGRKGLAAMTPKRRAEIQAMGLAARREEKRISDFCTANAYIPPAPAQLGRKSGPTKVPKRGR